MEKSLSLQANVQMSMAKEKEKIDNPFVTTGYAGAEYFCDRETLGTVKSFQVKDPTGKVVCEYDDGFWD